MTDPTPAPNVAEPFDRILDDFISASKTAFSQHAAEFPQQPQSKDEEENDN